MIEIYDFENVHIIASLKKSFWGAWGAQSVKPPTSAQVRISQFMGSSPTSGSALTAQSPEPASDSVSPSLSLYPSPACILPPSLSLSKINIKKNVLMTKRVGLRKTNKQ